MKNAIKYIASAIFALAISAPAFAQEQDYSAIRTKKTATYDAENDRVNITLDTWVAGYKSNIWTPATKDTVVPLDIVLVLDVSGSMEDKIDASGTGMQYVKTTDNISSVYDNYKSKDYYIRTSNGFVKINSMTKTTFIITWYTINGNTTTRNSNSIYEYKYISPETMIRVTKMEALQNACENFINIVAESSENGSHKIAVVKFAGKQSDNVGNDRYWDGLSRYSNTQIVKNLTDAGSTDELKNAIWGLYTGGATSADYGLNRAEKALGSARTDSKKLIVFFTDGEPNHGSGFDTDVADNAIQKAKAMKDNNVTIYTVGVFGQMTATTKKNVDTYMNNVSSNYPAATSMTSSGNPAKDKDGKIITKYYLEAKNAAELSDIFETIAGEEAKDTGSGESKGAGANLAAEHSVHIKDIVTPYFTIPQTNGVPDDIKLTVIPAKTVSIKSGATRDNTTHAPKYEDYVVTWETDNSKFETITPKDGEVYVDGNTLIVDGHIFDFSANWTGVEEKWTQGKSVPDNVTPKLGKKLIITFSVKPNYTKDGGEVTTNEESSGIYSGEEQLSEHEDAGFDVPPTIYLPANIFIKKTGMNPGESAIFEISASNASKTYSKTYTVAMTADENGNMSGAKIMRVPIVTNPNAHAEGETPDFIRYTVKETSWSWAYTTTAKACEVTAEETVSGNTITRVMTSDEKTHIFEFVNTPKADQTIILIC